MQFYILKNNEYLCMSRTNHHLYFSNIIDEAIVFYNERMALNIAYDYGACVKPVDREYI